MFLQGLIVPDEGLGVSSEGDLRVVSIPGNPFPFAVSLPPAAYDRQGRPAAALASAKLGCAAEQQGRTAGSSPDQSAGCAQVGLLEVSSDDVKKRGPLRARPEAAAPLPRPALKPDTDTSELAHDLARAAHRWACWR